MNRVKTINYLKKRLNRLNKIYDTLKLDISKVSKDVIYSEYSGGYIEIVELIDFLGLRKEMQKYI